MVKQIAAHSGTCCVAVPSPPTAMFRRRALLKSGASRRALLAVQAAMSAGIILASPAHAQTVLSANNGNTVYLTNNGGPGGNPFTVSSGTDISGASAGIYGGHNTYTLSNSGMVSAEIANGIEFLNGGTVSNAGTIQGGIIGYGVDMVTGISSISNTSTITGASGVALGGGGVLTNSGSIGGSVWGVLMIAGQTNLYNSGTITGGSSGSGTKSGIYMSTGYVSNSSQGLVSGLSGINGNIGGAATLVNAGTIEGTANGNYAGAEFTNATVSNSGLIYDSAGLGLNILDGGTLANTGSIIGGGFAGVDIANAAGFISNDGTGTANYISGAVLGVLMSAPGGTIVTRGTIIGAGTDAHDAGIVMNGGYLYNQAEGTFANAGTISGAENGVVGEPGAAIGIVNGGTIESIGYNGIGLYGGGSVTNAGAIYGGVNGINAMYAPASISNTGIIIGEQSVGVGLSAGGSVYNAASGIISGVNPGVDIAGGYGIVINRGQITSSSFAGIGIYHNGTVANLGGTITGASGVQFGYAGGTVTSTGTVYNTGLIIGNSFAGIGMYNGGQVDNGPAGTIEALNSAAAGIYMAGGPGSVSNYLGIILGGQAAGGIELTAGGSVYNNGTIEGGFGIRLGSISSAVFNAGLINGATFGVELQNGGYVGNGVNADAGTVGSIYGSLAGVQVDAGLGTVVNDGLISADNTGTGIMLYGGGSVSNTAVISGLSLFTGTIHGGVVGVAVSGGAGSIDNTGLIYGGNVGVALTDGGVVDNTTFNQTVEFTPFSTTGTISGGNYGVFASSLASATVFNSGFIAGQDAGVYLHGGGIVTNNAGGGIYALGYGVKIDALAGYLSNAGIIQGSEHFGADLSAGGTVINAAGGYIGGANVGVFIGTSPADTLQSAGTVRNAGTIFASQSTGIVMLSGGYVSNSSSGTIAGAQSGIYLYAQPSAANAIINAGTISGQHYGVGIAGTGPFSLDNQGGGSIAGSIGAYIQSTSSLVGTDSVTNAGLILGTLASAVSLSGPGTFDVNNSATGTITGNNDGIDVHANQASIVNAGLISGVEDGVYSFEGVFTLENLGTITAVDESGVYAAGSLSALVDNYAGGTIASHYDAVFEENPYGSVQNSGILTGRTAVDMQNAAGALLNTNTGTITGVEDGVFTEYGEAVSNAGLIIGNTYAGVGLYDGGELVNSGVISGGIYGVVDYGGYDNLTLTNFVSLLNSGIIAGGDTGIQIGDKSGAQIANAAAGLITGTTYGVYVGYRNDSAPSLGTIFNSGSIHGGGTGILLNDGGIVGNNKGGIITGGSIGIQAGYMGNTLAGTASIANTGLISGGATGILLTNSGVVTNNATGTISGAQYGIRAGYVGSTLIVEGALNAPGGVINTGNAAIIHTDGAVIPNNSTLATPGPTTVTNSGFISGGVTGVDLVAGGSLTNTGLITGGTDGIDFAYGAPASLTNAGRIIGTAGVGVQLEGGSLNNKAHGLIEGGTDGVIARNGAAILNAGRILDSAGPAHAGVVLYGQTSLTNLATGTISGATGVLVSGDAATIVDAGAIISTDGGDAIQILPSADPAQITLTTGSKLTGAIDGGGTGGSILLTGQNTLNDTIANFGSGSSLTIAPGATWTGIGNWTIANVDNTGTFQAGVLNTPLDLTGDFASTGTLVVVVTPTTSNQLHVTGTATFSGGLTYVFAPGTYTPGYKYDFVTATGGAKGDFTTVTYVGATPAYVSKTTNVLIRGKTLGSNLVLGGRISPLDGSIFADANQDEVFNAQSANDSLLGKAAGDDEGANAAACAAASRVLPNQTDTHGTSTAALMTSAVANAFCGVGGWIEATGATASIDNTDGAPGYSANDSGFLAGLDRPVTGFGTKLGLALGYDEAWANDKAGGKATADTVRVGLYAAQPIGRFTIAADIMYGSTSNTSTRPTGLGAATGKYSGNEFNGGVQISTGLAFNGFAVTPAAGLKFAAIGTGGFTETAPTGLSPFAVSPRSSAYTSIQPYLNVRLSKSFTTESLVTITPTVSLGYQLEAGNRGKSVNVTTQDASLFAGGHTNLDSGAANIGASIAAGKNNWTLYAKYVASLAGNYTAQAGEAGLQIRF